MSEALLIIEDNALLATEIGRQFERLEWQVSIARDLTQAREALRREASPRVVLADLQLPDGSALDLMRDLARGRRLSSEWVFLSGRGTIPDTVEALRLGAHDFLVKPCDEAKLEFVVRRAAEQGRMRARLDTALETERSRHQPGRFLGRSEAAAETRRALEMVAGTGVSAVLVRGETGTGKGLAARIIHYASHRAAAPLVEVNCAALPRDLLESELFGHEAGAFTGAARRRRGVFEQADGGTLFLDEIAEMNPALQAKLLKTVEDKEYRRIGGERSHRTDVRIVAATNRDVAAAVADGSLRPDLYHRLGVVEIELPTLRERPEDLEDLVPAFVREMNERAKRHVTTIPERAWTALRAHRWPGNVRELRNALERSVLMSSGEVLDAAWLQLGEAAPEPPPPGEELRFPLDGRMGFEEMERKILEEALTRRRGNITHAGALLGLSRQTMRYRIRKHGLSAQVAPEESEEPGEAGSPAQATPGTGAPSPGR